MRINKYIAAATGLSRRAADAAISQKQVTINDQPASLGSNVNPGDIVRLKGRTLVAAQITQSILLNKPVGYVCSRDGQGSRTIYDLLPPELHKLKSVGRLDKDSSGLLLMTNDGQLAHHLAHPGSQKEKIYLATLNKALQPSDQVAIERGVQLIDGLSSLGLERKGGDGKQWQVTMHQGRNRQIRRTFDARGYTVTKLQRIQFGEYSLDDLKTGEYRHVAK
jgi:23S rRNA pseudouridine2605 synthase